MRLMPHLSTNGTFSLHKRWRNIARLGKNFSGPTRSQSENASAACRKSRSRCVTGAALTAARDLSEPSSSAATYAVAGDLQLPRPLPYGQSPAVLQPRRGFFIPVKASAFSATSVRRPGFAKLRFEIDRPMVLREQIDECFVGQLLKAAPPLLALSRPSCRHRIRRVCRPFKASPLAAVPASPVRSLPRSLVPSLRRKPSSPAPPRIHSRRKSDSIGSVVRESPGHLRTVFRCRCACVTFGAAPRKFPKARLSCGADEHFPWRV
jgi:hypothetical protein